MCVTIASFYSMVAYTVVASLLLGLSGVRVVRASFRRRRRQTKDPSCEDLEEQQQQQETPALDLVPERRAPQDQGHVPFEDVMRRVLSEGRHTNPFY